MWADDLTVPLLKHNATVINRKHSLHISQMNVKSCSEGNSIILINYTHTQTQLLGTHNQHYTKLQISIVLQKVPQPSGINLQLYSIRFVMLVV